MSISVYGNEEPLKLLKEMIRKNREPHSIIIYGDKGLGKKNFAKYTASALMCESHSGIPCGKCRNCRLIEEGCHPDFITVPSNENGNYKVDDIRQIVSDSVVKPNDSSIKVYMISDLDQSVNTLVQVQNTLLKLIEEPPDHVAVIITARSKEIFLPTIISRAVCLGVVNVKDSQSLEFMRENYPEKSLEELTDACSAGRGNIGRCIEYLDHGQFYNAVLNARKIACAVAEGNEYEILKTFAGCDGKKAVFRESIYLFSEIVRDACVFRLGDRESSLSVSCDRKIASVLASRITVGNAVKLYDVLCGYIGRIDSNCNLTLTANSLAGQISRYCR